jgi:hypothetical protein
VNPAAFATVRQVVVFALGVAMIIDAFFEPAHVVAQLIVGMIMVGVLPADTLLSRFRRPGNGNK